VKNLDDAIARATNGNLTLRKFVCFCLHEDNPNIGFPDKDQELLDKLKKPDFMEKEISKYPTPCPNMSASSTNYNKPIVEIPRVDMDRS
jgi:hypothetical protein